MKIKYNIEKGSSIFHCKSFGIQKMSIYQLFKRSKCIDTSLINKQKVRVAIFENVGQACASVSPSLGTKLVSIKSLSWIC